MSSSPLWALQTAVFQHLSDVSLLTDLLPQGANSLYGHVPAMVDFPYVFIGNAEQHPIDTTDSTLFNITMHINCYSRADSMREIKNIASAISNALHQKTLTAAGYKIISAQEINTKIMRDDDGRTRQSQQIFRFMIEPV